MNLSNRFHESADSNLIGGLSYGQAWANAEALAESWQSVGLQKGDRVVVMHENHPSHLIRYLACMIAGLTACPVSPVLSDTQTEDILKRLDPALVFRKPIELRDMSPSLPGDIPNNDNFAIIFTSGTEARPKGVKFSLKKALKLAEAYGKASGMTRDTKLHHILPMAHNAGFLNTLLAPMMSGSEIVGCKCFTGLSARDFTPQGNFIVLTPTITQAILRFSRGDLRERFSLMKTVQITAGQLTDSVREKFTELTSIVPHDVYGLTELGGPLAIDGVPIPGVAVRTAEEVYIKSDYEMTGYLEGAKPQKDRQYYPTGDVGMFNGKLTITGRRSDLIVRGDINVSPLVVEEAINQVEGVEESAVVGGKDEMWGESVVAFVVGKGNENNLKHNIRTHCSERLSRSERPDRIIVVPELPKANGKVRKSQLREMTNV